MSEPAGVPVKPAERLFRFFRRGAVLHGDKFFSNAHGICSAGVPPAVVTASSGLGEIDASPSLNLRDGMAIVRRVPPRLVEFQLPLNVVQQPAGAEPEEFCL